MLWEGDKWRSSSVGEGSLPANEVILVFDERGQES